MPTVVALVGNPKLGSRTLSVARGVADRLSASLADGEDSEGAVSEIDLAALANEMFDWNSAAVTAWVDQVRSADVVVVASPVYKASFTGLLKAFLDRIPHEGLAETVVVPVMVGAAPHHAMAVDTQLRPVLLELGACCPTKALFVLESQLGDLDQALDVWHKSLAFHIPDFTVNPHTL